MLCFSLSALGMTCRESDAPLVANGQVTAWRRYLRLLEGDVSCDRDFLYVGGNPRVRCVATSKWQPAGGHCARRTWTSGLVNVCSTEREGGGERERDNSECFTVEGHLTHYKWYDYKHAHTTYTKQLTKQTRPKKQKQNKKRNRHEQRKRGGRERDRQTETHRDRERQKDKDRQRLRQRQTETETDLIIHVYTCSMLRHTSTHTN